MNLKGAEFERHKIWLLAGLADLRRCAAAGAPREFAPQSVLRELEQLGRELRALEKVACRRMPLPLAEFHPPRWHTENTPIRKGRTPAVGCKQM